MNANIRILLIEDDQDDIELLQDALTENHVHASFDILMQGNRIIDWIEGNHPIPDLVILDLNLPKMHGREVLRHIRENKRFRHVPILIMTTSSQEDEKKYCLENGAQKFMTKPATSEGFLTLVQTILNMARRTSN